MAAITRKTLAEMISDANSDAAWHTARAEMGDKAWERTAAKREETKLACEKAAQIAAANPGVTRLFSLPGLTARERELVDLRLNAHG
jgi:hypothetical protein